MRVHESFILSLGKGEIEGIDVIRDKLPADTVFIRAGHEPHGMLILVISSEEFPELKIGEKIPEIMPVYEKK